MPPKLKPEASICFEVTPALQIFRSAVGNANRCLNTLLVGLETLKANEPVSPGDLVLTWHKPTDADEWRETRNFALRGTMVALVDGLDRYLRVVASIDGLVDPSLIDILQGRRSASAERRPTIPQRVNALAARYPGVARPEHCAAIQLLAAWRNKFVHRDYKFPLTLAERKQLAAAATFFAREHANADIMGALERYDRNEAPTLADLSTLIASTQRLARAFDEHFLQLQLGEPYALALLRHIVASDPDPAARVEMLFKNGGNNASGRVHACLLEHGGNNMQNRRAGAPSLTRTALDGMFAIGRNQAAELFGIERKKTPPIPRVRRNRVVRGRRPAE